MNLDYYVLLQINPTATSAEIKTAYRRLAKLFHPDKNPGAEEKFKIIKEAYETLIDPDRRSRYDTKRNYLIRTEFKKTETYKKPKADTFSEAELKRRQYYQEHYKSYTRTGFNPDSQPTRPVPKSNYKELTYLLISIPAAIALLLLLVNIYQIPKPVKKNKTVLVETIDSDVKTADLPYAASLAKPLYDTASRSYVKIRNQSGKDAVVFLRNQQQQVIRHYFMENNYQLFMEQIPAGIYHLYYYAGKGFKERNFLMGNIMGNFTKDISLDSFPVQLVIKKEKKDSFILNIPRINSSRFDTILVKKLFNR